MKVGYFDCFAGISGDMALGALVDSGVPLGLVQTGLDSLHLPIRLEAEKVKRCGLEGLKVHVHVPQESVSRYLPEIRNLIDGSALTSGAKALALKVFDNLGEAEAKAHGIPIERVHFHEVGALDSIADILGVCLGIDFLGLDRIEFSAISVGSGTVKCEHGLMPVPAPATAFLLQGIPLGQSPASGELTTPTGAALVKTLAHGFGPLPPMKISQIGLGAGTKTFLSHPNMVRFFVGEFAREKNTGRESDRVVLLQSNLDDQTPEQIAFLMDEMIGMGALDAWVTPILMKKGRPAQEISVLVLPWEREKIEAKMFTLSQTLGIRRQEMDRSKLPRESILVSTEFGPVRCKVRVLDEKRSYHPEYDDCLRIAREYGLSLAQIQELAKGKAPDA